MAIDPGLRERAEDLYVHSGLTLEQVARDTGITGRTLERWSAEGEWPRRQKERQERKRNLKTRLEELTESMVNQALATKHSQDAHAAIGLAKLTLLDERKAGDAPVADIDRPRIFLEDMEFIAETLKEIDPEGLKVVARSFEIIVARFKEKHEKAKEGRHEA